ncbi:ABC transporter substrate-binding protein [Aquincola sp. S2]|uniref:ABC transporter substrate-binding protein n=1 Tax=Pseudaquabacterium terrae TaxID=2732868 RepID=A0ABX2EGR8_9BURK|nr:ABC transporter substrate-binding protein [Aquabacterium terrae]NRF67794.1 ABC transporter substrate-binding protein [Aquabacterium terrae]
MPSFFKDELERHGFVEGRNLVIDRRYTERDFTRADAAAAELVALKPDVIFTVAGTVGARAAQRATRTIPIVFEAVGDPVRAGLVASLPRPGGNLTGTATFPTLDAKRAQILVEALGKPTLLAVLDVRRTEAQRQRAMEGWPEFPGTRVQVFEVERSEELPAVFERIVQQKASGLVVMHAPFTAVNHPLIAQLATKHRLPAIANGHGYTIAGLMLTYTTDFKEAFIRAADYVARILRGTATPADLPVEHLSRFPFVINQRVAREFGVRIPAALLVRADEVIE